MEAGGYNVLVPHHFVSHHALIWSTGFFSLHFVSLHLASHRIVPPSSLHLVSLHLVSILCFPSVCLTSLPFISFYYVFILPILSLHLVSVMLPRIVLSPVISSFCFSLSLHLVFHYPVILYRHLVVANVFGPRTECGQFFFDFCSCWVAKLGYIIVFFFLVFVHPLYWKNRMPQQGIREDSNPKGGPSPPKKCHPTGPKSR